MAVPKTAEKPKRVVRAAPVRGSAAPVRGSAAQRQQDEQVLQVVTGIRALSRAVLLMIAAAVLLVIVGAFIFAS